MNPLSGNPFRSREDAQRAVLDLFKPLVSSYVAGGARVSLGATATTYDVAAAELEAFVRPLWGLVPLAAGGGQFDHWNLFRKGLARGTDPRDSQYWGAIQDTDQRMVEVAPIGLALALVPEQIFDPLSPDERQRVLDWLAPMNCRQPVSNNWWFFRVLANLGFARVNGPLDLNALDESLSNIDKYWLGDGWYRDGDIQNTDFYNAWAFHFYGLIYAVLANDTDPDRSARFRERARRFAGDWEARFDSSGRIVPYGRSLTYRFGAAAFWGALAFAGEEALPWGRVRRLWAQHLRWWADQPIGRSDGVESIGWSYPNLLMSETYNGPGSPYWSLKVFLPLALGTEHPFWSTPEEEGAGRQARHVVQRPAVAVVNRDEQQVQLLNGGRGLWILRQGPAKYGKFAYSSAFGFSLDPDDPSFEGVTDSMLVLRDDNGVHRLRSSVSDSGVEGDVVWSRWQPFPDVEVVTVLCGEAPWHARIHAVRTGRTLETFESGFAIGADTDPADSGTTREESDGAARVWTAEATSIIVDAAAKRRGHIRDLQPNTNLLQPRAVVPLLSGSLNPGRHLLTCIVAAAEAPEVITREALPSLPERAWQVLRALAGEGPGSETV